MYARCISYFRCDRTRNQTSQSRGCKCNYSAGTKRSNTKFRSARVYKTMKVYKIKFRIVDKDNFDDIKEGRKIYETRAATVKYKNMLIGDKLEISCGKSKV